MRLIILERSQRTLQHLCFDLFCLSPFRYSQILFFQNWSGLDSKNLELMLIVFLEILQYDIELWSRVIMWS
jgi:hypothetical protein